MHTDNDRTHYVGMQRELEGLARRAIDLRVSCHEGCTHVELCERLVPQVEQLAADGLSLLAALLADLHAGEPVADVSPLCDLASMARWDLRRQLAELDDVRTRADDWQLIGQCSCMKTRLIEGLLELERALARFAGSCSCASELQRRELARALAIRYAYQSFRRAIRLLERRLEQGHVDLVQALRSTASNLAKLIGRDVYEDLPVDVRRQVRALQGRVLDWARQCSDDGFSARRIWLDLAAFAELLGEIQQREVLREHDLGVLVEIGEQLDAIEPSATLPIPLLERLGRLAGRDVELDELLEQPSQSVQRWSPVLRRVRACLARSLGLDAYADPDELELDWERDSLPAKWA